MTDVPVPAPTPGTARRSLVVFVVLAAVAAFSLAGNAWGGLNFPNNAPVEQVICSGIIVDAVVALVIAIIGILVARRGAPVRAWSVLSIIGLVLTAGSLAGILVTAWVPSAVDLSHNIRLHYSTETFATFVTAPLWLTGLAFCAFAFRRGATVLNNLLAGLGLGFGIVILLGGAASAVIYGLGISS